jgi:hypothetical protein
MNADNISALRTANSSFNARLNIINPDAVTLKGSLDIAGRPLKQTRLGEKFAETREPKPAEREKKKMEKKTREKKVRDTGFIGSLTPKIKKWFSNEVKMDISSNQNKGGWTKGLASSFNNMNTPALKKQFVEFLVARLGQIEGDGPNRTYLQRQINRFTARL